MKATSSLVNRIGVVVGVVVLTAVVSMATTLAISRSIEGNATAINLAGSLRMGAYQLLAIAADPAQRSDAGETLESELQRYDARLAHQSIRQAIPDSADHPLTRNYRKLVETWSGQLREQLKQSPPGGPVADTLLASTTHFVGQINDMVGVLEQRTEARIDLLHVIQVFSLTLSVIIVLGLFLDFKTRVLKPLRTLMGIAEAVGERDFTRKARFTGTDELSQLGVAFDKMTGELAVSYHELETEALIKTRELEKSHKALELLHIASRSLFANHDLCSGAIPMLQDLEQLLGIGPIRLFLHDKNVNKTVEAITTATVQRPYYCKDHHCNACLVTPEEYDERPSESSDGRRLLLPIRTSSQLLGTLEVWYPADEELSATARRLLEILSDQLATAIYLERQITEEQQLTLAEERAVIARELHDSLAQSLSYLKMQVARLRRLEIGGEQQSFHSEILDELSLGLNNAYRQLRELLTTFRLNLDTPDLATALQSTVNEFSDRLGKPVELAYTLPPSTLSPNEEIHTLQIVREGLANAVKHAQATEITVRVSFESPRVQVSILDNGKGLPVEAQPLHHYGLVIMQDRARTLGGKIAIQNRPTGGVEVTLSFVPKSRHLIAYEASNG
ncbi:ATP-binding protein [Marinobacter changyiensis]|uniref:ATP-binding protein n=1 Tax=Marinobacter changyiensis TaxID=2604091 RepID=UPI001265646F|nr:ATP-binding protein [Marinobacter changyiensis]